MKIPSLTCLVPLICLASGLSAQAAVSIYLSANGIESAETSGFDNTVTFSTETFSTPATGYLGTYATTIGTYSGDSHVIGENIYGGYQEGNYLGIYSGEAVTLTLNNPAAYFGFYFSAGDAGNVVELYNGSNLLLTFRTADLIAMLPPTVGTQIQAINGNYYNTADYYGQPNGPNGDQTRSEPYAYVHFVGTAGTTFNKIVFRELHTATFETDNHTVLGTAPTLPGTLVDITTAVPEPSGALILLSSMGTLALLRRRSR